MKHCGTQMIETDRLILRKFSQDDAAAMFENWASDVDVTKFLVWPAHDKLEVSQSVVAEWVDSYKQDNFYQWAIILKDNGERPIGNIGVVDMNESISMVHIGYCIGKQWWHQGITSEALKALMEFFFTKIEVNRIESRHDPRNMHSGAVMKKCGMKYEGTQRSADWNNQGICDASYYAILKSDWEV